MTHPFLNEVGDERSIAPQLAFQDQTFCSPTPRRSKAAFRRKCRSSAMPKGNQNGILSLEQRTGSFVESMFRCRAVRQKRKWILRRFGLPFSSNWAGVIRSNFSPLQGSFSWGLFWLKSLGVSLLVWVFWDWVLRMELCGKGCWFGFFGVACWKGSWGDFVQGQFLALRLCVKKFNSQTFLGLEQ